jgi:hypothetical protein
MARPGATVAEACFDPSLIWKPSKLSEYSQPVRDSLQEREIPPVSATLPQIQLR